jgi:hypothetical protein
MSLAACGGATPTPASQGTPEPSSNPVPDQPPVTVTPTPEANGGTTATDSGAPLVTLTVTPTPCPTIAMPTATGTATITPSPTSTPGIPSYTYFDKSLLSTFEHPITGLSALMVYEHYLMLWDGINHTHTGWWWNVYGNDADGFSFWDYIALYANHEGEYHHPEFVDDMSEAGVRFWYTRVDAGLASTGEYGFIDWWASFSQSEEGDIPENFPDRMATDEEYRAFHKVADNFRDPPIDWRKGQAQSEPYGWGNRSAYEQHSNNAKVGQMLDANAKKYPIIFKYIPGGDPFYVPSGCAVINWVDSEDADKKNSWNPNVCDYLLPNN